MVRVLHVSQVARAGVGTCIDLIYQMAASDHQHLAVVPNSEVGDLVSGVPVQTYADDGRGPQSLWRLVQATRQAVRDFDPDVIFVHSSFAMVVLPFVVRGRAKVIYCAHGWAVSRYDGGAKAWLARQVEGRLPGLADVVVNISAHERDVARSFGYRGAHRVIENAALPVDPVPADLPAVTDKIRLVFVGRVARQKGLDLLLAAMTQVARPDLELRIVGGTAAELGDVPPGVTALGWMSKPQAAGWIAAADAIVVPSRWEGFGLVVAEAHRLGTPALVSHVGALPDLVAPGATGEVYAPDIDAIAAMLAGLDRDALHAMGPACKAAAARFAPERYGAEMVALFNELATVQKTAKENENPA